MAIFDEVKNAFQQYAGRTPTEREVSEARDVSVGQLEDYVKRGGLAGLRSLDQERSLQREQDQIKSDAQKSTQLAIQTLEGAKPKIGEIYGARRQVLQSELEPTRQRYEQLLSEVTRRQQSEETRQTGTTSRELARRGISSNSGVFDTALTEALSPITQFYAGQAKDVGLGREDALRSIQNAISELTAQESQQNLGLLGDIANLQYGGGQNAASLASNLLGQRTSYAQSEAQRIADQALQDRQFQLQEKQMSQPQTQIVDVGGRKKLINSLTGQVISDLGSTVTSGNSLASLFQSLGSFQPTEAKPTSPPPSTRSPQQLAAEEAFRQRVLRETGQANSSQALNYTPAINYSSMR